MKKKPLFAWLLTALILSGCGTGKPSTGINVEMTDFAFTPSQFTVPAGEQITLQAVHDGLVEHDFVIMKLNIDVGDHFDEGDLANVFWQIKIQPGDSQTVTFTAPTESGSYQIVCGMAGHVEAGMVGQLVIVKQ